MDSSKIRNVVFDLDGTLVDSAEDILDALRLAATEAGIQPSVPLTSAVIGPPVRGMLDAWGVEFSTTQAEVAVAAFRRIYDTSPMPRTEPYPGVVECLERLILDGRRIFVATNKPHAPTAALLERHFPGLVLDFCCTNSLADRRLNKLEMLVELAQRHQLNPGKSVIVGDGESDLRAGKQLGWRTMAALYGYGARAALLGEAPHWSVDAACEVADILLK